MTDFIPLIDDHSIQICFHRILDSVPLAIGFLENWGASGSTLKILRSWLCHVLFEYTHSTFIHSSIQAVVARTIKVSRRMKQPFLIVVSQGRRPTSDWFILSSGLKCCGVAFRLYTAMYKSARVLLASRLLVSGEWLLSFVELYWLHWLSQCWVCVVSGSSSDPSRFYITCFPAWNLVSPHLRAWMPGYPEAAPGRPTRMLIMLYMTPIYIYSVSERLRNAMNRKNVFKAGKKTKK